MTPTVVRGADLVPRPWPNGRGITRDVVRRERGNGGLDWMASIAELTQDAPFSHFPDCDRTFTLIAGDAVALDFSIPGSPGDPPLVCRPLVPALFPGDRPCASRLLGAAARAFNVMAGRGVRVAEVAVRSLAAGHGTALPTPAEIVHCVEGRVGVEGLSLATGDTALDVPAGALIAEGDPAVVLIARLHRV